MATVEQRLNNLEIMMKYVLSTMDKDETDANGHYINLAGENGNQNNKIAENDSSICDVAELSDVNSQAIDDLAEIVDELSNKIAEMEG